MKKKFWAILIAVTMVATVALGLAGCRNNEPSEEINKASGDYGSTSTDEQRMTSSDKSDISIGETETTSANKSNTSTDESEISSEQGDAGDDKKEDAFATDISAFDYTIIENEVCITGLKDTSLTEIVIPSKIEGCPVTSIGNEAFSKRNSLSSIELPNTITSIGDLAFYYCSSLGSIKLPNTVTSIGNEAFFNCRSLSSIELPNTVTSIGYGAFFCCSSLSTIELPNAVTSIGYYAFDNTPWLYQQQMQTNYLVIGKVLYWVSKDMVGTFVVPEGVTSIGDYSCSGCRSLSSIELPNTVTNIGDYVFDGCINLSSIIAPKGSYAEEWALNSGYAVTNPVQ
ncbi:MAG: leucine-rich repeat domain-containing protein [Lachnospiraceae bacterium]|nr:leucine-rich repeat domain-containing protein [Lachnospiraceae bacterium]